MIDNNSATFDTCQDTILSENDLSYIVVVTNAGKHNIGTSRCRRRR